jgi:ABC-type transport system substrate-binding protein
MDVSADTTRDIAGMVSLVLVAHDFDVTTFSLGILDDVDAPYLALRRAFSSTTKTYGYGNAEMDAAIDLLRTADTDAKRTEAYKQITELWVRDMPAHIITGLQQGLIMTPKLHGVERTGQTAFHFSKAWLEK